jgi:DNA-directed RNA polymerase subunit RPC12/RpoP
MGHKAVCIDCRKSLNREFDDGSSEREYPCANCGKPMLLLPHRFRPPKKDDDTKWNTVAYLLKNGFYYQHIYELIDGINQTVAYPESLKDAKEFVEKYRNQAKPVSPSP